MSKYGTDENGWPLVPCDPAAIPEGYEPVRMGWPKAGEASIEAGCGVREWEGNLAHYEPPRLIIRPIPKPIRLPLAIVPHGWWVARDSSGLVWCYELRPRINGWIWEVGEGMGRLEKIPPWIASQLPQEWHDLPWDKSAVQQTEGGEG